MQQLPTQSQPYPLENRCPGYLSLQLAGTPIEPNQIDLHLTINFYQQCERLSNGSVTFGLKGGKLKLKVENGKIPYELRELTSSVKLFQEQTQAPRQASTQSRVAASASEEPGAIRVVTQSEDKIAPTTCQVTTKGSPQDPAWIFAAESEPILQGSLKHTKLATLQAIALPCVVEATFEVSLRDIYITESQGWSQNLHTNQLVVLKRGIARLLLKQKLQPYLSRVKLQYD